MSINERLGLARAELRRQGQDTRSESFNVTYGLSRDLVTEALLVLVVMVVCAIVHHNAHRNLIAAAIVAAGAVPRAAVNRRHRQARANTLALSRPLSPRSRRRFARMARLPACREAYLLPDRGVSRFAGKTTGDDIGAASRSSRACYATDRRMLEMIAEEHAAGTISTREGGA